MQEFTFCQICLIFVWVQAGAVIFLCCIRGEVNLIAVMKACGAEAVATADYTDLTYFLLSSLLLAHKIASTLIPFELEESLVACAATRTVLLESPPEGLCVLWDSTNLMFWKTWSWLWCEKLTSTGKNWYKQQFLYSTFLQPVLDKWQNNGVYVLSECVFGLNYSAGCRVLQGDSAVEVEYSNMSLTCQMLALRRPLLWVS